ncbi:hypothetical protein [Bacillus subtilis]|uniref:hypothetical protein n=1 Tax=Bacillus subtilis TaxID=1423 RepID=UPI00084A1AF3|nr:hypothetical protein [Bacillus subtilis]ODV47908.1 hypothetical protein BCM26_05735 [Bacillus subtilis]OJH63506.1 hypothetical protein BOH71_09675 [Bacillus subtilis]
MITTENTNLTFDNEKIFSSALKLGMNIKIKSNGGIFLESAGGKREVFMNDLFSQPKEDSE